MVYNNRRSKPIANFNVSVQSDILLRAYKDLIDDCLDTTIRELPMGLSRNRILTEP
jgi:hypothetical protein